MNAAYLRGIERAADREAAAIDLEPRAIGAAVDAASFRRLQEASKQYDAPISELIRDSLSLVLGCPIEGPQIRTGLD